MIRSQCSSPSRLGGGREVGPGGHWKGVVLTVSEDLRKGLGSERREGRITVGLT